MCDVNIPQELLINQTIQFINMRFPMDLSAYERRILNAIPSEQRTEILARYAVAVARQLRACCANSTYI